MASPDNRNKNNVQDIQNAIQGFMGSSEYQALKKTAGQALDLAQSAVGQGMAQASDALRRQQEIARRDAEVKAIRRRYRSAGGIKAAGYIMAVVGAIYGVIFALATFGLLTEGLEYALFSGVISALFWWMFASGRKRIGAAKRYDAYQRVLGPRKSCTVNELSAQTGTSPAKTASTLRYLIGKGMFREGCLDEQTGVLLVTSKAYNEYLQARSAYQAQQAVEASKARAVEAKVEAVQPSVPEGAELSPEVRAFLQRGRGYLDQIAALNAAIDEPRVTEKVDRLEAVVAKIFERAVQEPDVIDDLGQLMDYYLPTTVKLLDAYEDLEEQPVQGENIRASRREIEGTIDTLTTAYEKLLDSIFKDMAWDVSTDISVLNALLAQDGLVEDPLTHKPTDTQA